VTTTEAVPRALPDEGLPYIGWRATMDDGTHLEEPGDSYLSIDRKHLVALSVVLHTEAGDQEMVRIECPRSVYRRRTHIDGIGRRTIRFLAGCGCHPQGQGALFWVGPEGAVPQAWENVELLPEELAAGVVPAPMPPTDQEVAQQRAQELAYEARAAQDIIEQRQDPNWEPNPVPVPDQPEQAGQQQEETNP
jgi:hypothetical protein